MSKETLKYVNLKMSLSGKIVSRVFQLNLRKNVLINSRQLASSYVLRQTTHLHKFSKPTAATLWIDERLFSTKAVRRWDVLLLLNICSMTNIVCLFDLFCNLYLLFLCVHSFINEFLKWFLTFYDYLVRLF